jgi:hypothetical protein
MVPLSRRVVLVETILFLVVAPPMTVDVVVVVVVVVAGSVLVDGTNRRTRTGRYSNRGDGLNNEDALPMSIDSAATADRYAIAIVVVDALVALENVDVAVVLELRIENFLSC